MSRPRLIINHYPPSKDCASRLSNNPSTLRQAQCDACRVDSLIRPPQRFDQSRPDRFHCDVSPSQPMRGHETLNARLLWKPVRSFHSNASASRLSNSPSTLRQAQCIACRVDSPIRPRSDSMSRQPPAPPHPQTLLYP